MDNLFLLPRSQAVLTASTHLIACSTICTANDQNPLTLAVGTAWERGYRLLITAHKHVIHSVYFGSSGSNRVSCMYTTLQLILSMIMNIIECIHVSQLTSSCGFAQQRAKILLITALGTILLCEVHTSRVFFC